MKDYTTNRANVGHQRTSILLALLSGAALLSGIVPSAQAEEGSTALPELLIQSSPLKESLLQTAQPVSVTEGSELHNRPSATLGEVLGNEPGVASNSFGPGSSRPVIRGLGGDRVRVLEGGVGSLDVSNTSPDHLTTIDPLLVERVEVVRGPATLLYGTSAVGGVVNVISDRIPTELPETPVTGRVEGRLGSVDEERTGATAINGRAGNFAFHLDGVARQTNNIQIPGFARSGALREEFLAEEAAEEAIAGKGGGDEEEDPRFVLARDRLPNSSIETNSFSFGSSYIGESGYLGASADQFNSQYGLPSEDGAYIDAIRNRFGLQGELRDLTPNISSLEFRSGFSDYSHTEFEPSGEPGTNFLNEAWEGRVDLRHSLSEEWEGAFGVQLQWSDFSALGEEAFQPPTETAISSLFLFEEYRAREDLHFQLGSRFDYSDLSSEELSRVIPTWSFSGGIVWNPVEKSAVALSLNHTERAPSGQELFSNGPHVATAAFEIGDPELDTERVTGVDLSFRREAGPVTGSVSVFYNHFDNYIGQFNSGEEEDGLPVYLYQGVRANFYGFEASVKSSILREERNELTADLQWDYVRAEVRDRTEDLPRITPMRARAGLNYKRSSLFDARIELQHVFEQDDVAALETTTESYTFLNASVTHTRRVGPYDLELYLQGVNLTDQLARNHVSFVKDLVPLPGRNLMLGARFRF